MVILGIKDWGHDTNSAIVKDGKIIAASEEEKFDRIKHSGNFPTKSINFCLKRTSISINEVDEICVGMDWIRRAKSRFDFNFSYTDPCLAKKAIQQASQDLRRSLKTKTILTGDLGYKGKISFLDHHDCHAAACYFSSKFKESAIITVDGAGEKAATRIYHAKGNEFKKLMQFNFPNSLGAFYSLITAHLGFKIDSDEGKVMGLAPYGDESLIKQIRKLVWTNKEGYYKLKSNLFNFAKESFSEYFIRFIGSKRGKHEEIEKRHKDLAFATQKILEDAVVGLAKLAKKTTGCKYLCLGGGVALNSVANGKIVESGLFDDIFIYPASGDGGTSVGAALYSYYFKKREKVFYEENQSPYLGYSALRGEIIKTLKKYKLNYLKYENIEKETARLLSKNKIIGWFSGRTEFGPRALGNRSILADPRDPKNKDRLNAKVKFRESFRPFAPSVLEEFADEYFDMCGARSPYMILTFNVKSDKKHTIPAVVHIDNTRREFRLLTRPKMNDIGI